MIVFIGCVKKKVNYTTEAQFLYNSTYFKYCLQYSKKLNANTIYILSAKYGLLSLSTKIAPYNLTLNSMTSKERQTWALKVLQQMKKEKIDFNDNVIFLCGKKYRQFLEPYFSNSFSPFDSIQGGIGKQLQFLKKSCDETTTI